MADHDQSSSRVILTGGLVIVSAPDSLIECTFLLPAIRALRSALPLGTLAILCPQSTADFWIGVRDIRRVIPYPDGAPVRAIVQILQNQEPTFESAISFVPSAATEAFAKADIKQRIGRPAPKTAKYLTHPVMIVEEPAPINHRVEYYLQMLKTLGLRTHEPEFFQTPPLPTRPERPRIVISPWSELGASYQWTAKYFAEISCVLSEECAAEIVLASLPGGEEMAVAVQSALSETEVQNVAGQLSLAELLDALPHCTHLVGVDGALPHLAARFGIPTTVIFGPNEPAWKRPLGTQHSIVREHVPCSPCFLAKCPLDHRCMTSITPAQVVTSVKAAILKP